MVLKIGRYWTLWDTFIFTGHFFWTTGHFWDTF